MWTALFETVSGFTTTGASILTDVEALPKGLSVTGAASPTGWAAWACWCFCWPLPALLAGSGDSMHIMRAESPGPQVNKLVPQHLSDSAQIVYMIYIGMTAVQIVLMLAGRRARPSTP